ncbi:hypothetical protein niasHT_012283 [Heterodera trifolii]|uniref:Ubiquitin-like domain-containing protein n=1 Tax=Heterodera trifolii TaxID=157864 RepID=A0ABD2LDW1_9BILA
MRGLDLSSAPGHLGRTGQLDSGHYDTKVINGNDQTDGIAGPSAAHQQQNVSEQYYQSLTKLELGNKLLKAELKQREMMEEIKNLKNAKMEQQQKEDDLVGHTQKLADEQKKCLDKYNELKKELARKYSYDFHQINGQKEMGQGSLSRMPVEKNISVDPISINRSGIQIFIKTSSDKIITLNDVRPSTTIWEIKAKIKDIDFDRHKLTFDGYTLKDNNRTLADYNIGNGDKIHIVAYIDWWH